MSNNREEGPYRLLFVCLGNICRSPMAMAITRHLAARLRLTELIVESAGLLEEGRPASFEAEQVAAERGLSLVTHLSRKATPELVSGFDLVLTMEPDQVLALAGHAKRIDTITRFVDDPAETVPDPYGEDVPVYRRMAERLFFLCERVLLRLAKEGHVKGRLPAVE